MIYGKIMERPLALKDCLCRIECLKGSEVKSRFYDRKTDMFKDGRCIPDILADKGWVPDDQAVYKCWWFEQYGILVYIENA